MADPFVAEIRIVPFNFAPRGWAHCNGQIMPISQNTALFSLLGITYGGNGQSTFALPNLQGRAPMHPGQGPSLSNHALGEAGGTETVSLQETEMPAHTHTFSLPAVNAAAITTEPGENLPAVTGENSYGTRGTQISMSPQSIGIAGGSQPHNNTQPHLTLSFIIALQGVFPPRS